LFGYVSHLACIEEYNQFRQQVPSAAIRQQLHISHSAPNLAPMQAQFTRRHAHHHHGAQQQHVAELQGPQMSQQQQQQMNKQMGLTNSTDSNRQQQSSTGTDPRFCCLVNVHRVGIKAMETMGTGSHDDNRSYVKYSQVLKWFKWF
jgi:hypothetical protein